jgi:hypothetical protein
MKSLFVHDINMPSDKNISPENPLIFKQFINNEFKGMLIIKFIYL